MKRLLLCLIFLLTLAAAASAQVVLQPVASGLSSPVFVTGARDGTDRLFIVEQPGTIKVRAPSGAVSTFFDIRGKVLSGGERGLLGLAFHPSFRTNGRFFVYYTRGDGAIVVEERPSGVVLLTVPHPLDNHNGGMLAFGPSGHLYIGVGDGGGANDPPNNAQNLNSRLGKILRINVDTRAVEVYALGLRNPWRFSFDRGTGILWCADVGQDNREEIDLIVRGGNYGWRIYEGSACSGNDPSLCGRGGLIAPIAEYSHTGGRCSITGGYIYRGAKGTFPLGAYLYADYCSGEVWTLAGGVSRLLMHTALNISSFGEDDAGELYVVGHGGAVYRLAQTLTAPPPVAPPVAPPVTGAPVLQSLTPNHGVVGSTVLLKGTGFGGGGQVVFRASNADGAQRAVILSRSSTQILAVVPANAITGAVYVRRGEDRAVSNKLTFTVDAPPRGSVVPPPGRYRPGG